MAKVLIVEDDVAFGRVLLREVERAGHAVRLCATLVDGLAAAAEFGPDAICLDVKLPDGNGLDSIRTFVESEGKPELLVLSGNRSAPDAERAIRGGAWDYFTKGDDLIAFSASLGRALDYHVKQTQAAPLFIDLGGMIGRSPTMKACYSRLAQAAASEAPVLITGESGTGKELAALAIHSNSSRRKKSFVVVDCAALPEMLVESMLFGHRRGSFTGAVESRIGLLEQANGGTLFLDEVAELPLLVQKAFLRTLQEKTFRPVGSDHEVRSDFRVVAATNRDLDAMVAQGTFRADLLFRLRAIAIELPPLRERGEDVREIAVAAVSRICLREGHGTKGMDAAFALSLLHYAWPGNVRELLNAIEHAVAKARGHQVLLPIHLPTELRANIAKSALVADQRDPWSRSDATVSLPPSPTQHTPLQPLAAHRHADTQRYLETLIAASGANVVEACRVSGLSRSRLYALLKEHGLSLATRPRSLGDTQ